MPMDKPSEMWAMLQAYTFNKQNKERPVNHNNEWGGFSKRLNMAVFTGWRDLTHYDKETKTTTSMVLDTEWKNRPVGIPNQLFWLEHAEEHNNGIACFIIIHAVDTSVEKRKVESIDHERVFVGKIEQRGTQYFIAGQPREL